MGSKNDHPYFSEEHFRFQAVSQVRARLLMGISLSAAIEEVSKQEFLSPRGQLRAVSSRSLYRWCKEFELGGVKALKSAPRRKVARALPAIFASFLEEEKRLDPQASVPELIRRARLREVLDPGEKVSRTTVYRACIRMGLPLTRVKKIKYEDMRRFAYENRMQMVLCDGKHFRAGSSNAKRVALIFLDDATRMALHSVVGPSESTELFLKGLFETIQRHGLMVIIYVDNGPGFISGDTMDIAKKLGISLVHGEKAYPEGHGKVERFNQTLLAALLRGFRDNPSVNPNYEALSLRLDHYLNMIYNHQPHESLDKQSPRQRFDHDPRPLNFPENEVKLKECFVIREDRSVSKDNLISVGGVSYEMPIGYARKVITVYRKILEAKICFCHENTMLELQPVNLVANAHSKRVHRTSKVQRAQPMLTKTSADLAFEKDMGPLVGPDGNFYIKED